MTDAYSREGVVSGAVSLQFFKSSQNPTLVPTQGLENLGIVNQTVFSIVPFTYTLTFDAKLIAYYINGTVSNESLQVSVRLGSLRIDNFNQTSPITNNSMFHLTDQEQIIITNTNVNNPLFVRLVFLPYFRDALFNP